MERFGVVADDGNNGRNGALVTTEEEEGSDGAGGSCKMQQSSEDYKQKRAKFHNEEEDPIINQLPDGIPVTILSKLPINEAARTTILSRKWRHLWKFFSGALEFDGSPVMKNIKKDINKALGRQLQMAMEIMFDAERKTYTNWINELFSSLKSPTLEGLRFWFHVATDYDVEKWLQYAIQKKVHKLELYFGHSFEYVLPLHLFKVENFDSLRVLRLKFVTLTSEMLEYLLCCCPSLETLSLNSSGVPNSMKISSSSGSSLKLKCLELVRCWELRNLEICAENLVSLKYCGPHLDTEFRSVPRLVEAEFGGSYVEFTRESFISQIKVLKLDITQNVPQVVYWLCQLPELKNLKHLELVTCMEDGITLSTCALLLKASPSLWRFTLKMLNINPIFRRASTFSKECEYSLKELELVGFCGATCEVELIMYMLENAVRLQKIIIDTRFPTKPKLKPIGEHSTSWDRESIQKRALELHKKIPSSVEVVCL
ncbi:hypothetical protein Ahy_A01g002399 [Arachis hypogaea]|uniref:At1g61320/AtMIF1 LRR domain-containing protein n=1 Tax=Arachis hypogaea TaxID=3818 RepID=A0A445EQP2_ARAHY|nr:hypothetical protein Ahy_A01g002399 [Arachis hypogaea]